MRARLAIASVSQPMASEIALAGIVVVIGGFILVRARAGSKWRRLALGLITIAGCCIFWLGAWLALQASH